MKIQSYFCALACAFLLLAGSAKAQLPTLSQFWLAPQLNTPAAVGGNDYMQVNAHYRRQSLSEDIQYQSFVLAAQLPLYYSSGKRLGTAGLMLLQDRTGPQQALVTNGALASFTYDVSLSSKSHLLGGVQFGYFMRSFNWSKVSTDAQWQWGNYNPDLSVGENFSDERSGALQTNVGLGYYLIGADGSNSFQFSAGAYNLNRGRFTYLSDGRSEALPLLIAASATGVALRHASYDVSPMLRWQLEAGVHSLSGGALIRKGLKDGVSTESSHLGLGVLYRSQQAGSFTLQFAQPSFVLAIGYDIAFGKASAEARNAVEATLSWRLNKLANKGKNSFREVY